MLLGKRPRPPMKRTTSMSEITLDLNPTTDVHVDPNRQGGLYHNGLDQSQRALMAATACARNHRRHSADFIHNTTTTTDFLRACSLCKRPLVPSRDIYMYRGDSAFCSLECRQQAMNQDERKEKCSLMASKKKAMPPSAASKVVSVSTNGETVAAL